MQKINYQSYEYEVEANKNVNLAKVHDHLLSLSWLDVRIKQIINLHQQTEALITSKENNLL